MNNFNIQFAENKTALQGNLDPKILLESEDIIKEETHKLLEKFKDFPGYIFNLGHGLTPDICPDKVRYLTELVRDY
jgi:uroporphyrinogen decarboxylase